MPLPGQRKKPVNRPLRGLQRTLNLNSNCPYVHLNIEIASRVSNIQTKYSGEKIPNQWGGWFDHVINAHCTLHYILLLYCHL